MNPSNVLVRLFIAIVVCIIAIAVLGALNNLTVPLFFNPRVEHLLDVLIVAIGACYVIFGNKLFPTSNP